MIVLESQVEDSLLRAQVNRLTRNTVYSILDGLKHYDFETYLHSMRAGLHGAYIAQHFRSRSQTPLVACLTHDAGKLGVPLDVLQRKGKYTSEDRAAMNQHPEITYNLLSGAMEFTAQVGLFHHQFQSNPYPIFLPKLAIQFSKPFQDKIVKLSNLVSIVDVYDRITHPTYSGVPAIRDSSEIKKLFLNERPKQALLASSLIDAGVLRPRFSI